MQVAGGSILHSLGRSSPDDCVYHHVQTVLPHAQLPAVDQLAQYPIQALNEEQRSSCDLLFATWWMFLLDKLSVY